MHPQHRRQALSFQIAPPTLRAVALGIAASALGLGLVVLVQACNSDSNGSTGGRRVVLHTRVALDAVAASTFTTDVGWDVTLTKAVVATGPFYYFDGAPPLALSKSRQHWEYAARWLGLATAHAHPGHYQAGNATGQMLEPSSVDLLVGAADFPDGDGVSGTYRSARFSFSSPAVGPVADALAGYAVVVEGKAEMDGEAPRFFRALADMAGIEKSAAQGQIDGCEFSEVDVEADGTVTVTINPKIWFGLVDFTEAQAGSAEDPAEFPDDSQPELAFVLGVTQLSAYEFSFSTP